MEIDKTLLYTILFSFLFFGSCINSTTTPTTSSNPSLDSFTKLCTLSNRVAVKVNLNSN